ncbi:hypothetical protein [Lentiprolixibacter aurantiacus]|uniref:Cupin domain-containing protein n=1 Tax=Lentiprolixibacter aurantiacus TaxID=2993939 RepID=A0AAE3MJF9_9FLAO|nr:hypothetical protein [Lentiprolixibacter aurantiacus]MCX2718543.1 hypothetical protein [Lentiprolixibacter aurantiacus]
MKKRNLKEMTKGWFVGNFEPTVYQTNDVEVAIKEYNKGDFEDMHYHKLATEITTIVSGSVLMNGKTYQQGDIIIISPFESTDFKALEDTVTAVVKIPGANNDKYMGIYEH